MNSLGDVFAIHVRKRKKEEEDFAKGQQRIINLQNDLISKQKDTISLQQQSIDALNKIKESHERSYNLQQDIIHALKERILIISSFCSLVFGKRKIHGPAE